MSTVRPSRLRRIDSRTAAASGVLLLALSLIDTGHAQQSKPAPADASADSPVTLNPFVISSDQDVGYLAQSSLSASRLNSNMADMAVPTTAFTPEFIQDTGARSVEEMVGYMTSTQVTYPEANQAFFVNDAATLQIRGLPAANYSVNYFSTTLRLDTYNLQRVDLSRGANSILFGLGSPGGVVNISTNRAIPDRTFGSASLRVQSNNGLRGTLDYNQVLIKNKLSLRLDVVRDHGDTWRTHEYDHQDRAFLTLHAQLAPKTLLDIEAERGVVNKSIGSPSTAADLYTTWQGAGSKTSATANAALGIKVISTADYLIVDPATGQATDWKNKTDTVAKTIEGTQAYLTDFSLIPKSAALATGPAFPQKTSYNRASAFLAQTIGDSVHLELAGDAHDAPRDTINGASFVTLHGDPNVTLPNGQPNPNVGRAYTEGFPTRNVYTDRAESLRLTASFSKDFGRWGKHDLAFLGEEDWSKIGNLQMRLADLTNPFNTASPEAAANLLVFRTYLNLQGPASSLAAGDWRGVQGQTITETLSGKQLGIDWVNSAGGSSLNRFDLKTAMAVLQSHFFNNRLITVGGFRENWQDSWYSPTNVRGAATGVFKAGPFIVVPGTDKTFLRAHTATASGVYHVTSWFALTYNWATDFALPSTTGSTPFGRVPPPEGHSRDAGFKIIESERLSLSALYFETSAKKNYSAATTLPSNPDAQINTIWTALGAAGVKTASGASATDQQILSNGYTYDAVTKGYEVELTANPTSNWRIFGNFSYNKSVNTNLGLESINYEKQNRDFWLQGTNGRVLLDGSGRLAAVANDGTAVIDTVAKAVANIEQLYNTDYTQGDGQRPRGQVPYKVSARTNYTFSHGFLKGFGVGGGVRYSSEPIVAFSQATSATPVLLLYGPQLTQVDANLSYRLPVKWGNHPYAWFAQINADNLLDDTKIVPMRESSTGQVITYRLQAPRRLSLTLKLDF